MTEQTQTTKFDTLTEVELREAWPHEAIDFTPWLADNLTRISEVIGVDLELVGTEVAVGRFSADILARNPQTDSLVLIENQLAWSDHSHIGQILTYLAGLEAQTVVWIARNFEEEHLSAIRWLNDHTDQESGFFAVRLRVVRIATSPLVPLFEVLEQPNNWERQIRNAARNSGPLAETVNNRRMFWTHYSERYPQDGVRPNHGTSNFWIRPDKDGPRISLMLARDAVGIFFTTASGVSAERVSDWVKQRASIIQKVLHIDVDDDYFCYQNADFDAFNRDNWDGMADWLHDKLQIYLQIYDVEPEF